MTLTEWFELFNENSYGYANPVYLEFYENFKALVKLLEQYGYNSENPAPLDQAAISRIILSYSKFLASANSMLSFTGPDGPLSFRLNSVINAANKDREGLANFKYHEGITLPEIIEDARDVDLHEPKEGINSVGSQMNTRLKLLDEKGNTVFFTAETSTKGNNKILLEWGQKIADTYPDYGDLVELLINTRKQGSEEKVLVDIAQNMFIEENFVPHLDSFQEEDINWLIKNNSRFCNLIRGAFEKPEDADEVLRDKDFWKIILDFETTAAPQLKLERVLSQNHIAPGSNIEKRNAAMSSVAGLLGVSDLIAYSKTASFKKDGVTHTGIVMEKAEGLDIGAINQQNKDPEAYRKYVDEAIQYTDVQVWDTPEAKMQLADMEVLDYICGNTDRHSGNMLYKFTPDENGIPRLAKITGIDNDLSFGVWNGETAPGGFPSMPRPARFGLMRKTTALNVLSLNRETLVFMLGDKLKPEEINAAWERTQEVQEKIREALLEEKRSLESGTPIDKKDLRKDKLVLYDDEDFQNITLNEVSKKCGNVLFRKLDEQADHALRTRTEDFAEQVEKRDGNDTWKWKGERTELYQPRQITPQQKVDLSRLVDMDEGAGKTALAVSLMEGISGQKLLKNDGSYDQEVMNGLLDHVCQNGIPFRAMFSGDLSKKEDCENILNKMADLIAEQMDDRFEPMNNVTFLYISNDPAHKVLVHQPLAFTPPEPAEVTLRPPGTFSTNKKEKQAAYDSAVHEYEEAKAYKEKWEKRNQAVADEADGYKQTVQDGHVRMNFQELADEFAHQKEPRKKAKEQKKEDKKEEKKKDDKKEADVKASNPAKEQDKGPSKKK